MAAEWGVVYKAEDTRLHRFVALKFLPGEATRDHGALDRFRREAEAASALNHPNICTIYDVGEQDGQPFIAMEFMEGHTLKHYIEGKPLPADRVLDLGLEIADATITADDLVTTPGAAVGTMAFMSPEQVRGEELDSRTDLFSFGLVLYEMGTGLPAFPGHTSGVITEAILNRAPVPLTRLNPGLPPKLEEIINKALEKDRDLRYQHASEIRTDLTRLKRDTALAQTGAAATHADHKRSPRKVVAV